MAISWKFSISEIGNSGSHNVSAVVTDDSKVLEYQKETVSVQGKYDTPEHKEAIYKTLKEQYAKKAAATDAKAVLELSAKTDVEKP